MDNIKAITKRINKELKIRGWSQTKLLRKLIRFRNPNLTNEEIEAKVISKKGNFSSSLKGSRSISKDDLYAISKVFGLPLEYIRFGDEKKSDFIPKGARYAAYQDNEEGYRSYMADLENEDKIQYPDELGFSLFDYLGQYESINGYRFFVKNYGMHFNYTMQGNMLYTNKQGFAQICSLSENKISISYNLLNTLVKYKDVGTFKEIYFSNESISRLDPDYHLNNQSYFDNDFLALVLENEAFLDCLLKTKQLDIHDLNKFYGENEKREFLEPMFYEVLSYALENNELYEKQLKKILNFALSYNESQYEFVKDYLTKHEDYADVHIDEYAPRNIRSCRDIPMGNIIDIQEQDVSSKTIKELIKHIEKVAFDIRHIISKQEKNDGLIRISTPDNPLFIELCDKAIEKRVDFVPIKIFSNKEFTSFKSYETCKINYENADLLSKILDFLERAQSLVEPKTNKVLIHGDLNGSVIMMDRGNVIGLSGWENCHYGNKYEDRAYLLSNFETSFYYRDEDFKGLSKVFNVLSKGFDENEKETLIDEAIKILKHKKFKGANLDLFVSDAFKTKKKICNLEFFKEYILK